MKRLRMIFGIALIWFVGFACGIAVQNQPASITTAPPAAAVAEVAAPTGAPAATATPAPTEVPAPTATPQPTPYASGGLGLTIEEWKSRYGEPGEQFPTFDLYLDTYEIWGFNGTHVQNIVRRYTEGVSIDFADGAVKSLLPDDATFIREYEPESAPHQFVVMYHSDSLAQQLKESNGDSMSSTYWINSEPGDFIVLHSRSSVDNKVVSSIIATGNNP